MEREYIYKQKRVDEEGLQIEIDALVNVFFHKAPLDNHAETEKKSQQICVPSARNEPRFAIRSQSWHSSTFVEQSSEGLSFKCHEQIWTVSGMGSLDRPLWSRESSQWPSAVDRRTNWRKKEIGDWIGSPTTTTTAMANKKEHSKKGGDPTNPLIRYQSRSTQDVISNFLTCNRDALNFWRPAMWATDVVGGVSGSANARDLSQCRVGWLCSM